MACPSLADWEARCFKNVSLAHRDPVGCHTRSSGGDSESRGPASPGQQQRALQRRANGGAVFQPCPQGVPEAWGRKHLGRVRGTFLPANPVPKQGPQGRWGINAPMWPGHPGPSGDTGAPSTAATQRRASPQDSRAAPCGQCSVAERAHPTRCAPCLRPGRAPRPRPHPRRLHRHLACPAAPRRPGPAPPRGPACRPSAPPPAACGPAAPAPPAS